MMPTAPTTTVIKAIPAGTIRLNLSLLLLAGLMVI